MSNTSAKTAVKIECCSVCKDGEKRDLNLDYGTYYYEDGGRKANVVEVFYRYHYDLFCWIHAFLRQATTILSMMTMTTWRVTWAQKSHITILCITTIDWKILNIKSFWSLSTDTLDQRVLWLNILMNVVICENILDRFPVSVIPPRCCSSLV